jgi:hypothetical protein
MEYTGPLEKMQTHLATTVTYYLSLGNDLLKMNDLLGKTLLFEDLQHYTCFCGQIVPKVFRQNFCYECFFTKPEAGEAIFNPEKSKAHLGEADRDLVYEQSYQLQPHVVYLAQSGGVKVGVTRAAQLPTRWIDQGASEAIVLAKTINRFEAGQIEVFLKNHFSDKTVWQRMLKNESDGADLLREKERAIALLPKEWSVFVTNDQEVVRLQYPVSSWPTKTKSIKIEKEGKFTGVLTGIRGQYLIFDDAFVMNVRSQEGRWVRLRW